MSITRFAPARQPDRVSDKDSSRSLQASGLRECRTLSDKVLNQALCFFKPNNFQCGRKAPYHSNQHSLMRIGPIRKGLDCGDLPLQGALPHPVNV
jgi:hypothetical protein